MTENFEDKKQEQMSESYKIFFVREGNVFEATATEGLSILEIAQTNGIELDGNCGGAMSCGSCHIIMPDDFISASEISDGENDVLDVIYGTVPGSRLGCQVFFTPKMNGIRITIPTFA